MLQGPTKQTFDTGAQRDSQDEKPRPDLISPFAKERLGWVNKRGADRYGERNYEAGMPFSRVIASMDRHYTAYLKGDTSEDHLAQLVWNGMALLHYEEAIKFGLLSADLNDLPRYLTRTQESLAAYYAALPKPSKIAVQNPDDIQLGANGDAGVIVRQNVEPIDPRGIDFAMMRALRIPDNLAKQVSDGITYTGERPKRRKLAYVAGPMRGIKDYNFPAFDEARDNLCEAGFDVISPADIDREAGDEDSDNQVLFAARDFFALWFIRKVCDLGYIVMLPGWESSTGASAELLIARWIGLTVLDARTLRPLNHEDLKTHLLLQSIRSFLGKQLLANV